MTAAKTLEMIRILVSLESLSPALKVKAIAVLLEKP